MALNICCTASAACASSCAPIGLAPVVGIVLSAHPELEFGSIKLLQLIAIKLLQSYSAPRAIG